MKLLIEDNVRKPIIVTGDKLRVLLDSGAEIPVWTKSSEYLEKVLNGKLNKNVRTVLSGFGGKGSECKVYVVPELCIVEHQLIFRNLPVAVYPDSTKIAINAHLVLPVCILKGCRVEVNVTDKMLIESVNVFNTSMESVLYCVPKISMYKHRNIEIPVMTKVNVLYQNELNI